MQKLTGKAIIVVAAKHNHREILAELGGTPGCAIDPSRTPSNRVLRGAVTAAGVAKQAQAMMAAAGITALRKDAVRALEIVVSLPPDSQVDQHAFFNDAIQWAEAAMGAPVISAVVHNDEATPHAHILILPLVNGRMVGSDLMGNRAKLQTLQSDFHMKVGQRYGLTRQPAPARFSAAQRRQAIDSAFTVLDANSGLQSSLLRVLLEPHRGNPAPLLQALGIDMPAPKPKAKDSFAAMMTRPCKPEPKPIGFARPNPIGFDVQAPTGNEQTLSCVGFADSTPSIPCDFEQQHGVANQRQPADNDLLKTEHVLPATATANRVPENLGAPRLTDHAAQAGAGQETWSDFKSEQSAISDATTAGHDIAPATPTPRARSNSSTSAPRTGFETVSLAQARGLRKISDTPEPIDHQGALAASKSKVGKSHFDRAGVSQGEPGFSRFDIDTLPTDAIRRPSELVPPIGTPAGQSAENSAHLSSPEFSGRQPHGADSQGTRRPTGPTPHPVSPDVSSSARISTNAAHIVDGAGKTKRTDFVPPASRTSSAGDISNFECTSSLHPANADVSSFGRISTPIPAGPQDALKTECILPTQNGASGDGYERQRDDDRPAEHWNPDTGEFVSTTSAPARPPGRHGRAPYSARASPADITHELLALAGATEPKTPTRAESES
jgi:hypothetical protein